MKFWKTMSSKKDKVVISEEPPTPEPLEKCQECGESFKPNKKYLYKLCKKCSEKQMQLYCIDGIYSRYMQIDNNINQKQMKKMKEYKQLKILITMIDLIRFKELKREKEYPFLIECGKKLLKDINRKTYNANMRKYNKLKKEYLKDN